MLKLIKNCESWSTLAIGVLITGDVEDANEVHQQKKAATWRRTL